MNTQTETKEPDKKITIGVAIPMSATHECKKEHWDEVYKIIKSTFDTERYSVNIVSKSNEMAVIQDAIVNNLYHNDIVICDVSCGNPNVMFELGMRLAFDKPTLVIKDFDTPYSFDTAPIRHIEYPRSLHYQSILDFKKLLSATVDSILENHENRTFLSNFGNLTAAKLKDTELPENEFILKTLENLSHKIDNLELKNSRKVEFNSKYMVQKIEDLIWTYCNNNKITLSISDDSYESHKVFIRMYVSNEMEAKYGAYAMSKQFDAHFEQALDNITIPF